MEIVTYIIVLFILLGLYFLMSYLSYITTKPKLELYEVEAGSTESMVLGKTSEYNGNPISPHNKLLGYQYDQFVVKNDCMAKRKIFNRDIIIAELFKDDLTNDEKMSKINQNDILLIYLDDEDFKGHKIRVFKNVKDNKKGLLNTFYYNDDGSIHDSSHPHNLINIKGIVRRKVDTDRKNYC